VHARFLLFLGIFCALAARAWSQQRPLKTDDANPEETGKIRAEFGAEFLRDQRFSLSGLEGNLIRVGVASIHVGVGEYAEFQISGVFQDLFSVQNRTPPAIPPTFSGNSTHDFGDLVLATKMRLVREQGLRPAIAFKFAVELPNAKHNSGLGTDQTEFFAGLLFSRHLARAQLLGNVGFAILGSPVLQGRQTDPLTYGLALVLPVNRRLNLVGEISGRQGPESRLGNENQSQVRAGIQMRAAGLRWDIAGIAGLKEFDPVSGLALGVTYEIQAFHKNRPAKPVN
jgi:hypothetical protein